MAKHGGRHLVIRCNCSTAAGGFYTARKYEYPFPTDSLSRSLVARAKGEYIEDENIDPGDRDRITTTTSIRNNR